VVHPFQVLRQMEIAGLILSSVQSLHTEAVLADKLPLVGVVQLLDQLVEVVVQRQQELLHRPKVITVVKELKAI
jgi:hypothetical protein